MVESITELDKVLVEDLQLCFRARRNARGSFFQSFGCHRGSRCLLWTWSVRRATWGIDVGAGKRRRQARSCPQIEAHQSKTQDGAGSEKARAKQEQKCSWPVSHQPTSSRFGVRQPGRSGLEAHCVLSIWVWYFARQARPTGAGDDSSAMSVRGRMVAGNGRRQPGGHAPLPWLPHPRQQYFLAAAGLARGVVKSRVRSAVSFQAHRDGLRRIGVRDPLLKGQVEALAP